MKLYGISQCDQVRKAKKWLSQHQLPCEFHDFRLQGISPELLAIWCEQLGWQSVLNRRSTTWRTLSAEQKTDLDQSKAIQLMQHHPTLIKRPVLDDSNKTKGKPLLGFSEQSYQALLQTQA